MTSRQLSALLFLLSLAFTTSAFAADPCGGLSAEKRANAERIMGLVFPHDCCDDTLAACVKTSPSRLVSRLRAEVCRRVADKDSEAEIVRALEKRGASMVSLGKPAAMDLSQVAWVGEANGSDKGSDKGKIVEVVVYACARCPFCAKSIPALYAAITTGALKGKARFAFRLFPIRSHPNSAEAGLAFEAAHAMGAYWPYVLKVFTAFDDFALERLPTWAQEVGLDPAAFSAKSEDPATRKTLVEQKKEGLRLKVKATPTYFISGRLYSADMATISLIDAIEEEHERLNGTLCSPRQRTAGNPPFVE
jgi:protein-disulfide isomerase